MFAKNDENQREPRLVSMGVGVKPTALTSCMEPSKKSFIDYVDNFVSLLITRD